MKAHCLFIFSGLNDEDHHGNRLVERQVPWVVPARLCHELQDEVSDEDEVYVEKPREVSVYCVLAFSVSPYISSTK